MTDQNTDAVPADELRVLIEKWRDVYEQERGDRVNVTIYKECANDLEELLD